MYVCVCVTSYKTHLFASLNSLLSTVSTAIDNWCKISRNSRVKRWKIETKHEFPDTQTKYLPISCSKTWCKTNRLHRFGSKFELSCFQANKFAWKKSQLTEMKSQKLSKTQRMNPKNKPIFFLTMKNELTPALYVRINEKFARDNLVCMWQTLKVKKKTMCCIWRFPSRTYFIKLAVVRLKLREWEREKQQTLNTIWKFDGKQKHFLFYVQRIKPMKNGWRRFSSRY